MDQQWEVSHIAYAVDRLENWMDTYGGAIGGEWTHILDFDTQWRSVLTGEVRHMVGRSVWLNGQHPPIELWEGGENSPFYVPPGTHQLHHIGIWGEDLPGKVASLEATGYELEYTPLVTEELPPTDGEFRGFAYMRHPDGIRVEIHSASFREGIKRWLAGGPRWLPGDKARLNKHVGE